MQATAAPEATHPKGRTLRPVLGLAAFALVFALVLITVGRSSATLSVETLVDRVEQFAATAESFGFEGTGQVVTVLNEVPPRTEEVGFTTRGVEAPDRRRFATHYDTRSVEFVQDRRRALFRTAKPPEELADVKWEVDGAKKGRPSLDAGPRLMSHFEGLRDRAEGAEVVRRDGGNPVLRLTVPPDEPDASSEYLEYEVELTVSTSGVPHRLVERSRERDPETGRTVKVSTDLRFSGWGEPIDIDWPRESEIAKTSGIDHAAITAYRDAPLLQPAGIPAGWTLDYAGVLEANRTVEGCDQLELDYVAPNDPRRGYLYFWEFPVACADMEPPAGAALVRSGPWQGWITQDGGVVKAQIADGTTVVQAETDLTPRSLARVLSELVPLDLSKAPDPLNGLF